LCFLGTLEIDGGFWNWSSLYGSSVRGTWRRGTFTEGPEGHVKKVQETGISLHSGTAGEPAGGAHLLGTLKDRWRRTQELCKRRLWANLSIRGPVGKPGGGFIYWGLWVTVIFVLLVPWGCFIHKYIFMWFIPIVCDYNITIDKVGKLKQNKSLLRYKESKDRQHVSAILFYKANIKSDMMN